MPLFHYTAVSEEGKKKSGYLQAPSLEEAKRLLHTDILLSLALCRHTRSMALSSATMASIIDQLASLLTVGMPLYESLTQIAELYRNERFYPTLLGLCEQIHSGSSLADAMKSYNFPPLIVAMVFAGQQVGRLDLSLRELSTLLAKQQRLHKQLFSALLYPLILLAFSSILVVVLLAGIIPSLEQLFQDHKVAGITHFVFGLSHLLVHGWPWLLLGTSAAVFCMCYAVRTPRGRQAIERILLRLPFVGTLIVQREVGRLTHLIGVLLKGGVPLLQAVQIARESLICNIFKQSLLNVEQKLIEGTLLSNSLGTLPWIPPLTVRLIAIGEEGGTLTTMLEKIATLYEGEVDQTLTRLTTLAQPILLLLMGAIIGLIMMAVLLPLTDVNAFI